MVSQEYPAQITRREEAQTAPRWSWRVLGLIDRRQTTANVRLFGSLEHSLAPATGESRKNYRDSRRTYSMDPTGTAVRCRGLALLPHSNTRKRERFARNRGVPEPRGRSCHHGTPLAF